MKILIADDHQIIRYGLKIVLKSIWSRCKVFEADELDKIVSVISSQDLDLVIFHINIPGSENLEDLIRFIPKETIVVIFSAFDKSSDRIESLKKAGAKTFLFKDASVEEIKDIFSSLFINKSEPI
ncbi:response regulator transcription factor [Pedobacter fastidiosus]|uniref:Response regulator transcription factor n=1 Tax=Pedobacter fastidiosus TaxID=2765361 RepID=A0ABR7KYC6_9SPHI|nr:response regulator transcription factor [Pedobacter fastidiosus]MBC6113112.1 response regulator transcription factor [Pedobacter fastidiosus]